MPAAEDFFNTPSVARPPPGILRHAARRVDFDARPLKVEALEALERAAREGPASVRFVSDEAERAAVAGLVAEGDRVLFADPAFRYELMTWWRRQASSGETDADALLPVPDLFPGLGSFYLSSFDLGDLQARRDFRLAARAPLHIVVHAGGTPEGLPAAIHTARCLVAEAERLSLAASFFNQPVLVPDLSRRLAATLLLPSAPQVLLAVGVARAGQPD